MVCVPAAWRQGPGSTHFYPEHLLCCPLEDMGGGGAPHETIHTQKWGREDPSQGPPLPSKAKWTEKWESIPLSKTWCPFPDSILPPTAANLQGTAAVFSH